MQKMVSNKHASFGSGEKLLRCAGSLFTFLGPSLIAKSGPATHPGHAGVRRCSQPCSKNPCPQLSITQQAERGFRECRSPCVAH